MKNKTPEEAVLDAALRLLEAGDKTRRQLQDRLRAKAFANSVIERVLDRLEAKGLLNDEVFSERFIERLRLKSAGKRKIAFELRRRGIAEPMISEQLGRLTAETEQESLTQVGMRQWRRHSRLAPEVRRKKVFAFLARSGFDSEMIRTFFESVEAGTEAQDEIL